MSDFVLQEGAEGQRRFEGLLANRFPEIAGQISEVERGLLHLEMALALPGPPEPLGTKENVQKRGTSGGHSVYNPL
jgi:hypothetical protein